MSLTESSHQVLAKAQPVITQTEQMTRALDEELTNFHNRAEAIAGKLNSLLTVKQQLSTHVEANSGHFHSSSDTFLQALRSAKEHISQIEARLVEKYNGTLEEATRFDASIRSADDATHAQMQSLTAKLDEQQQHVQDLDQRVATAFQDRSRRITEGTNSVLQEAAREIDQLGNDLRHRMLEEMLPQVQKQTQDLLSELEELVSQLDKSSSESMEDVQDTVGSAMDDLGEAVDSVGSDLTELSGQFKSAIDQANGTIKEIEQHGHSFVTSLAEHTEQATGRASDAEKTLHEVHGTLQRAAGA